MRNPTPFTHPDSTPAKQPRTFRCWDGLLGCEETKNAETEFKWHPRICNSCALGISLQFDVQKSDFDLLALLLSQDAGLFRAAKYFKSSPDKILALQKGQEPHIKHLVESIKNAGSNANKIELVNMNYRKWFVEKTENTCTHA